MDPRRLRPRPAPSSAVSFQPGHDGQAHQGHVWWLANASRARPCAFRQAHVLLLDEPTSHLDLGAVVWLEAYLATYNHILVSCLSQPWALHKADHLRFSPRTWRDSELKAQLTVRHSADFMDTVCTNMMDLTMKKKLVYYGGNYSTYVRTKSENEVNR